MVQEERRAEWGGLQWLKPLTLCSSLIRAFPSQKSMNLTVLVQLHYQTPSTLTPRVVDGTLHTMKSFQLLIHVQKSDTNRNHTPILMCNLQQIQTRRVQQVNFHFSLKKKKHKTVQRNVTLQFGILQKATCIIFFSPTSITVALYFQVFYLK